MGYRKGQWVAICDVCGFRFHIDEMRKTWNGLLVDKRCYEGDHPQKFLRVSGDPKPTPIINPSPPEDIFIQPQYRDMIVPPGEIIISGYSPNIDQTIEETDPFWGDVLLLLNGTNIVTKDSGPYNFPLVSTGVYLTTDQTLFGNPTYRLTGASNGGRLDLANMLDANFIANAVNTGEWTVEIWLYPEATDPNTYNSGGRFSIFSGWYFNYPADHRVVGVSQTLGTVSATAGQETNLSTWHHIAMVRDNSPPGVYDYMRLYLNGEWISDYPNIIPEDFQDNVGGFSWVLEGYAVQGYVGALRVTKSCRYPGGLSFQVPTGPFPVG